MLLPYFQSAIDKAKEMIRQPLIINMLIVGAVTLLIKLIGFYKETLIAATFGLSELLDTFLIAVLIPSFIQNVFINALTNIFIPNYITELKNNGNKGEFQSVVFLMTFLISLFFFLLTIVFMNFFLEVVFPGHNPEYYILIKKQLFYLLPCLFFWGFSSLIAGLLEISNKYFASTISSVFVALAILFCLFFFKERLGDVVLAVGMLLGSLLSFLYLVIVALKNKELLFKKPKLNLNSRAMMQQLPPKISSGLLSGMNDFVDQFFAAQLVVGSITAINYGIKVPAFIISILILALGNVLLPHFSRLINTNIDQAYQQLFKILKTVFVLSFVIVLITIYFSDSIVSLLFERNEFTSDDTIIVSNIQKIAFIYIPFYLCTLILVRFLTSINKNKFMAWVSFFSLIANIILNTILIRNFNVYGLIMATAIIYILSSLIYVRFTLKQYKLSKLTS
jgi:putative peptidoglycan lipid II flippase